MLIVLFIGKRIITDGTFESFFFVENRHRDCGKHTRTGFERVYLYIGSTTESTVRHATILQLYKDSIRGLDNRFTQCFLKTNTGKRNCISVFPYLRIKWRTIHLAHLL